MSTGVYQKTAGDVIREALRGANISGTELPIEPVQFAQATIYLNDILASWQAKQIHLWSETEALLPLNPDQKSYTLNLTGDHCFTDYQYTTTTAAYLATETTFDVVSTAGMTVGDYVGIELADGTRWWDTIDVINSSTSLDTTNGVTGAVNSGASIYAYTTKIDQPVRILDLRYAVDQTGDEIPTTMLARKAYYQQPSKSSTGAVNSWYYSRQLTQGNLSIWPVASDCKQVLRFTFIRPQYIPEDQTDIVQIPVEWFLPLKFKLMADLGVMNAIDPNKQMMLEQKAEIALQDALASDNDYASFSFHPEDC